MSVKAAESRIRSLNTHLGAGSTTLERSKTSSVEAVLGPTSNYYISQRLRLHYVDWGNEDKPLMLMIHGGRDHCRNWDWTARILRDHYHIVAPDLRGHGDSEWAKGGEYLINEYAFDILNLVEALGDQQCTIVAHSLGGSVAVLFAALFPQKVKEMVIVEGIGGPPALVWEWMKKDYYNRLIDWTDQLKDLARRKVKKYPTVKAAMERMKEENPFLNEEQAHNLTVHGVMRNEDGTYSWKFDNYLRIFFPTSSRADPQDQLTLYNRVQCRVLLIQGSQSWAGDPSKDGRAAAFKDAISVMIDKAGHWVHHDSHDKFMLHTKKFLGID